MYITSILSPNFHQFLNVVCLSNFRLYLQFHFSKAEDSALYFLPEKTNPGGGEITQKQTQRRAK
jgi:hypothetical protein